MKPNTAYPRRRGDPPQSVRLNGEVELVFGYLPRVPYTRIQIKLPAPKVRYRILRTVRQNCQSVTESSLRLAFVGNISH